MYQQQYRFTLTGLSPLIMHWDNLEWQDYLAAERSRIKKDDKALWKAGDDRCPADTWKGYTYHDGTHVALPNDNLRSCLMKAGARVELKGPKSFKELTQCGILFDDVYIDFRLKEKQIPWTAIEAIKGVFTDHLAKVRKLGFQLLVKRAVIGQSKHVRVRPMFTDWSATGTLTVIDSQITTDVVAQLWQIAGVYIGLCDWRPGSKQSPGPYGRYSTEVEKV